MKRESSPATKAPPAPLASKEPKEPETSSAKSVESAGNEAESNTETEILEKRDSEVSLYPSFMIVVSQL